MTEREKEILINTVTFICDAILNPVWSTRNERVSLAIKEIRKLNE